MLFFKSGVTIDGIKPEMVLGLQLITQIYANYNLNVTVTSCTDGKHKEGSFHYGGLAVDLRTKDLKNSQYRSVIFNDLYKTLKPIGFDVILEDSQTDNEHIHIEFDPKFN